MVGILAILAIITACIVILTIATKKFKSCIDTVWGNYPRHKGILLKIFTPVGYIFRSVIFFFGDTEIIYYLIFAACCFLGVFFHEFWFSFTLTEIITRYEIFQI